MNKNDIARTSFPELKKRRQLTELYSPENWQSLPKQLQEELIRIAKTRVRVEEICPYCKNDNPDRIMCGVETKPFKKYYSSIGVSKFKVYDCHCCKARWSTSKPH